MWFHLKPEVLRKLNTNKFVMVEKREGFSCHASQNTVLYVIQVILGTLLLYFSFKVIIVSLVFPILGVIERTGTHYINCGNNLISE